MDRLYSLKEAKMLLGVGTKTIQRWDRAGKIRVVRTPGGRRRIPESEILRIQGEERREGRVMGYARVSSPSQKDDLERQVALTKNRGVEEVLTDVGSGLNEKGKRAVYKGLNPKYFWCNRRSFSRKKGNNEIIMYYLMAGCTTHLF